MLKCIVTAIALLASLVSVASANNYYGNGSRPWWYDHCYWRGQYAHGRQPWHTLSSNVGWTRTCYSCHSASSSSGYGNNAPDLESQILDIAARRDQAEAVNRRLALEYSNATAAGVQRLTNATTLIDKLGLTGNFRWEAYGATGHYGVFPNSVYVPNAQQGSTISQTGQIGSYQYPQAFQQPVITQQGVIDTQAIANVLARQPMENAKLSDMAHSRLTELVQIASGEASKANEINAVTNLFQALRQPSGQSQQRYELRISENGQPVVSQMRAQPMAMPFGAQQVMASRCVACHAGPNANKIDLSNWAMLSDDQIKKVLRRVTSTNPDERMPKNPDNSPGTPLELAEIQALFCDPRVGALTWGAQAQQPEAVGAPQIQLQLQQRITTPAPVQGPAAPQH